MQVTMELNLNFHSNLFREVPPAIYSSQFKLQDSLFFIRECRLLNMLYLNRHNDNSRQTIWSLNWSKASDRILILFTNNPTRTLPTTGMVKPSRASYKNLPSSDFRDELRSNVTISTSTRFLCILI